MYSEFQAPDSVMMKICCNSCRPAPWDSVLGYQLDPRPLCVPLTGLYGEGGIVGVIDLIIVRKYPVMVTLVIIMPTCCQGGI